MWDRIALSDHLLILTSCLIMPSSLQLWIEMCILFSSPGFSISFCSNGGGCLGVTSSRQHWERKRPGVRTELFAPKPSSAALVWAARRQQSLVLEGAFPTLLQHCTRGWAKMLALKQQKRKCTDFLSAMWELFLGVHCWRLQWCVLWKEDTVLLASVQHSTSGTAGHLWGASCLFCWNALPICLAVCMWPCLMRSTSPSAQCYSHFCGLCLLSWFISVKEPAMQPIFQSQLKFTCVLLLPFLKFTGKTWLSWPAKVTQQQLILLSSTFVSMWIGGWSTSVGMAPALGWCDVLAQSVTSNPHPHPGMCGCSVLLVCQSPEQMAVSSFIWQWLVLLNVSDSTRLSALQRGQRHEWSWPNFLGWSYSSWRDL